MKWNPIISAVQQQSSKALIVTVEPVDSSIAYLKVCINDLSSAVCRGDVSQIEVNWHTLLFIAGMKGVRLGGWVVGGG